VFSRYFRSIHTSINWWEFTVWSISCDVSAFYFCFFLLKNNWCFKKNCGWKCEFVAGSKNARKG
jgi:hypothetical protein